MSSFLVDYDVNAVTWFWQSLLLVLIVFTRFTRLWSLRNFDLILLLSLSPGLILVRLGSPAAGYAWLFTITGVLIVRTTADRLLDRRPRLEANLNAHGLAVLGLAVSGFLVSKIVTEPIPAASVDTIRQADKILNRVDNSAAGQNSRTESTGEAGPGTRLLATPAALLGGAEEVTARSLAILGHLLVVVGLIVVGSVHFRDAAIGIGMATLYLLLPCTAMEIQRINHVLPSALLVWSIVFYRKPLIAGGLLGLACGSLFFPIFLIPLWISFYDKRGATRFSLSLLFVGVVLILSLALTSADATSLRAQIIGSIDWSALQFHSGSGGGFWRQHDAAYRIPVFAAFTILLIVITIWPRKKNLEHLIASSATIILGTQFWYPKEGGVYMLWYLPLVLMVVFRPKLSNLGPPKYADQTASQSAEPTRSVPRPVPTVTPRLYR